jgi:hypothetical protein
MYGIASISFAEVDNEHPYGNIYGMIIVNATKGYFVGYAGWGNTTLYSFNPSNGTVYGPVSGLEHINIPGMEMGGGVDKYGRVWIPDATNHRIVILNATDDSIITTIDTELNPQKVVFVTLENNTQKAVIATVASDWTSGAISIVDVDTFQATNNLLSSQSDITVCAYGKYFYQIGRYYLDWVRKVDISDPDNPIWECSTMDENEDVSSSNPHALVFVNATKAYLLRYGTNTAWIVNPSASSCDEFKIGTLDLSAYDDGDGSPEMTDGIVVGDKVFILLQRLDRNNNWEPLDAYVAVFNATTDQEIDTGKGENGLRGIKLPVKNPGSIQYVDGKIYVQAQGRLENSWAGTPAEYTGGIVEIDPETYNVTLILDDGNETATTISSGNETTTISSGNNENNKKKHNPGCTINPDAPFDLWMFVWLTPGLFIIRRKFKKNAE